MHTQFLEWTAGFSMPFGIITGTFWDYRTHMYHKEGIAVNYMVLLLMNIIIQDSN